MSNQALSVWENCLRVLKNKVNPQSFEALFLKTTPVSFSENILTIDIPYQPSGDWLKKHYRRIIQEAAKEVLERDVEIKFNNLKRGASAVKSDKADFTTSAQLKNGLISKYIFDSFVIGDGNRFAYAAALAVAENPAHSYNPLFIYGGVGLGKTHLLHAIANYVATHNSHLKIKYVSSEKFTNDFIKSIGHKDRIPGFHKKYRNVDVLLVDDIQFLEKKEATQTEFFHTFNTLHGANKQIIISSDRPPKEIATLEDRLRSRFEWGLITDIQPPDLETRIAILKKKAVGESVSVPDDVLEFIASNIKSNIRELEGALIRVVAYSSLTKTIISLDLTKEVLENIISNNGLRNVSISNILKFVSKFYSIPVSEIIGAKRSQEIVYPRQIAMYLSRELTDYSLPSIGNEFGGRDHTTVIHANNKIQKLLKEDKRIYNEVHGLINRIKSNNSYFN